MNDRADRERRRPLRADLAVNLRRTQRCIITGGGSVRAARNRTATAIKSRGTARHRTRRAYHAQRVRRRHAAAIEHQDVLRLEPINHVGSRIYGDAEVIYDFRSGR